MVTPGGVEPQTEAPPRCDTCGQWRKGHSGLGDCRRYAPRELDRNNAAWAIWPQTFPEQWCGEWRPKNERDTNKDRRDLR